MTRYLLAPLLASILPAQTVLPPGADATEGWASDGGAWTWRTFRASCRYPASWFPTAQLFTRVEWRADSTYAMTYDRLHGRLVLRLGPWQGNPVVAWSPGLTLAFDGTVDPPPMVVVEAWKPQPFTFTVPLTQPVLVTQGGLEIDVAFEGPLDPIHGNRATYWVDAMSNPMNGNPTLADQWLDPVPPHMGCGGWASEARADRYANKITMEVRDTNLPLAPALVLIGATPLVAECFHVNVTATVSAVVDAGGWLQVSFNQPAGNLDWCWQAWIYSVSVPLDRSLSSGHWCRWRINDTWPCQTIYAYDATSPSPWYYLNGSAWVVSLQ